ncbi:hypothetical protein ZIOFF_010287 [Zingiber officinale]|uniref:Pentatricopeptide repeat-containing protein n=1 Tax=Zingiber officinale TaxID=94328 RepID=A0A8J5LS04_ZINOF|nr:hypothetical protein ZIOFF_010287 [Zingiber officinale]
MKNIFCIASISYPVICSQEFLCSSRRYHLGSPSESEGISLPEPDGLASVGDSCASDAMAIQNILKSHDKNFGFSSALDECKIQLTENLVVKLMQEMFDEIPKDRQGSAINDKTFAILVNRYAADFPLVMGCDDAGSCNDKLEKFLYKHVEEAEALFLQKQDQFPPLFTSIWEKGCDPDVIICNCIIDTLCFKKVPQALEIFSEMNDRGCLPDVTALLQRMERTGCKLDLNTYNLLLNLYMQRKLQKGSGSIWADMKRSGLDH